VFDKTFQAAILRARHEKIHHYLWSFYLDGNGLAAGGKPPVHIAIIGLVHDHAYGFIPLTRDRPDVQLVGIVEPDQELAASYAKRFNLEPIFFTPAWRLCWPKQTWTPWRPSRPRWIIDAWWKCARLCISM
jgi:hypothetical protein